MRGVSMKGVKIQGKDINGAEMFTAELDRFDTHERKEPKQLTTRESPPAWVITDNFSQRWPFNFTIPQIKRWWRLGIISEELALMQCGTCHKSFVIMREYFTGQIFCPYCGKGAQAVADQETYLTALCRHILKRDGIPYKKEKRK